MALSPELVHRQLHASSERFRWSSAGRYLVSGITTALFFLILFLLGDSWLHLGSFGRWLGFLLVVAPLVAGVVKALPAWRHPLSELAIARRIESSCAGSANALVNAVQFDRELPPGSALRAAVFDELSDPFPRVNWSEVFDLRLIKRLAVALGAVAAVVLLWGLLRPAAFANSLARVFLPASNIAALTRTHLDSLTPGNANVIHGGELELSARFSGEIPRAAWVRFREAGSSWKRELMSREVGTLDFGFHWKEVRQPMEYFVEAGDLQTPVYQVAVRARTAVSTRVVQIEPPAYAGLPTQTVNGLGALTGILPGSKLTFALDFNNPVDDLSASGDKTPAFAVGKVNARRWNVTVPVMANTTLALTFHDQDSGNGGETFPIAVKADEPPRLTISEPADGRQLVATSGSSLGVQFTAGDDYGLGSVGLYRSSNEKADAELVQDWPAAAGQKTFEGSAKVALARYLNPGTDHVTFCLIARDQNNVTGPGVTISRPLTIAINSVEKMQAQAADATSKLEKSLRELLKLQQTNLEGTRAALAAPAGGAPALQELLTRQVAVGDLARDLTTVAEGVAPEVQETLRSLALQEMPAAVLTLRNAAGAPAAARAPLLGTAASLEILILTRLQGAPNKADEEARRADIQNLIAGVDGLLRDERAILHDTTDAADGAAKGLSDRQDQLADQSVKVRKEVEKNAGNSSVGDPDFRARLTKIAGMFGEFRVYEAMLTAADTLGTRGYPAAKEQETKIAGNLQAMVNLLNQWQLAQAGAKAEEMRKAAELMKAKLDKLAELQRAVLEKSKELARKDQFSAADQSTAAEIERTKDLMGKVVEGMLTDANIFPDMIISNELKAMLTTIFDDVKQTDLDAIAKNQLKPSDVPVQKEDALLKAIEDTKKIPDDMEMYLPQTSNTANWLLENFDKTEIPKLDNLPLPDEMTDLIGDLQKEQESLADKVQGAASNQVMKAMQQGGPITDGPQSGYSAQGKSGNQKPLDIEQSGRSSGGREGESNGEMVGKLASDLEGRTTKVRRTNDAMQSGNVEDPTGKAADAKATGGGKASGFSQREGMDGDAPVRGSNAPRQAANNALAVAQALIAEKTSKQAATAALLFLRSGNLSAVPGLMQESATALNEGRLSDFQGLHKKIVAQLTAAKGEITSGKVLGLATGNTARPDEKQVLGGGEGEAPAPYKDRVADYYRSLTNGQ